MTVGDVLETATFYHFFRTTPSGRYRIYMANTAIAKMRGYDRRMPRGPAKGSAW